jgi:hypothetical protein
VEGRCERERSRRRSRVQEEVQQSSERERENSAKEKQTNKQLDKRTLPYLLHERSGLTSLSTQIHTLRFECRSRNNEVLDQHGHLAQKGGQVQALLLWSPAAHLSVCYVFEVGTRILATLCVPCPRMNFTKSLVRERDIHEYTTRNESAEEGFQHGHQLHSYTNIHEYTHTHTRTHSHTQTAQKQHIATEALKQNTPQSSSDRRGIPQEWRAPPDVALRASRTRCRTDGSECGCS